MASSLADMKQEWQQFRHDLPGERFRNHRIRMRRKSRRHAAVTTALGVLLLAAGVVLLFMPGPGLVLIVFGLALVATHSSRLSAQLDRAEPWVREGAHEVARRWRRMTRMAKAAVVSGGLVIVTAFLLGMWRWVISAYVT